MYFLGEDFPWVCYLGYLGGLWFIFCLVNNWKIHKKLDLAGFIVKGEITDKWDEYDEHSGNTAYYVSYQFSYQYTMWVGAYEYRHELIPIIGNSVSIYFLPNNPNISIIETLR